MKPWVGCNTLKFGFGNYCLINESVFFMPEVIRMLPHKNLIRIDYWNWIRIGGGCWKMLKCWHEYKWICNRGLMLLNCIIT